MSEPKVYKVGRPRLYISDEDRKQVARNKMKNYYNTNKDVILLRKRERYHKKRQEQLAMRKVNQNCMVNN